MDAERVDAKRAKPGSANVYGVCTWAAFIAVCLSFYLFVPELFDPRRLRELFAGNLETGLIVYFAIATLRGFTFIPLTPILLAGVLVFPPLPLFLVNQAAVGTSSAIVYGMARVVRSDRFARNRYPEQVERLAGLLAKRELPVIGLWGAAPFTPSDVIVYVCSVLRISLWKTLLGISIGEGLVCAIYIFGGSSGLEAASSLFGR